MGIAAYNRGSRAIAEQVRRDYPMRAVEFELMDRLNGLEKYADCGQAPEQLEFVYSRGVWWTQTARLGARGFAFCYPSLHEAVKRWNVSIRGYAGGVWIGEPK